MNALTVDVEDYHNILDRYFLKRERPPYPVVAENTRRLLGHFARHHVRATFFVLAEVAETYPDLIKDILADGHELGVHGYRHRFIFKMTPDEFRQEITRAKAIIEDIAGKAVHGHRAPAFSIMPQTRWALDILADAGFRYDSSIFPFAGRRYGWPGFPLNIHEMKLDGGRSIIEAPMTTVSILGKQLPSCGGGYIRHFPLAYNLWAMRRIQKERPAIMYMHPYEIEDKKLAIDTSGLSWRAAFRARKFHILQLKNQHTVERKILRFLNEFHFAPLGRVIENVLGTPILDS